jgi:hypothetical protein
MKSCSQQIKLFSREMIISMLCKIDCKEPRWARYINTAIARHAHHSTDALHASAHIGL